MNDPKTKHSVTAKVGLGGKKAAKVYFLFAASIFAGSFLLFFVQPMMGRFVLPRFGGSAEVWTSCMLFFQLLLLGGYLYSHWILTAVSTRVGVFIHLAVLAGALLFLPVVPTNLSSQTAPGLEVAGILWILLITVGGPYFALASTSVIGQGWLERINKTGVYQLYAVSNAAAFLALLSFPFLFEPRFGRFEQARIWSWAFAISAGLVALCGITVLYLGQNRAKQTANPATTSAPKIPFTRMILWSGLAGAAVVELLAVTNKICLDIAVLPFLWVLPLCLYLLSFVICFHSQRLYHRGIFLSLFAVSIVLIMYARVMEMQIAPVHLIAIYCGFLFLCCMVCHGELYRKRPDASRLSRFYLMISLGGALGGVFVAVIAPLIFSSYFELYFGLMLVILFLLTGHDQWNTLPKARKATLLSLLLITSLLGILFGQQRDEAHRTALASERNFYGVVTVWEKDEHDPALHRRTMKHGTTFHGLQFLSPEKEDLATAYYSPQSGIGLIMKHFNRTAGPQKTLPEKPIRVGVVGLGAGTIATYLEEGDLLRFYEINPVVRDFAYEHFTYLPDCRGTVEVSVGDGRLLLEDEPDMQYDVVVIDAFSSDTIPVHLLTQEAFAIYARHIKPGGLLAVHVSSIHLDLEPVAACIGQSIGFHAAGIYTDESPEMGIFASDWVILAKNQGLFTAPAFRNQTEKVEYDPDIHLWTDDHINVPAVLRWSGP